MWSEIKTEQAKSLVRTYLSQTLPILHAQVHVCYYKNIPKSDWSTAKLSFRKNSQDKEKSDFHSHEQNSNEMMAHQFHSFNNWQKVLKKICTLKLVKLVFAPYHPKRFKLHINEIGIFPASTFKLHYKWNDQSLKISQKITVCMPLGRMFFFIHSFDVDCGMNSLGANFSSKFSASNVCSCSNFLNQFAFLLTFCNKASLIPFVQTLTDCELVIGWLGSILGLTL